MQSRIAGLLQKPLEYITGIRCLHSKRKTRQNKTRQLIVSTYKKPGTKPAIEWALMICHLVLQMFPMREEIKKTFHLKPRDTATRSWVMLLHSFGYFYLKLSKPLGSIGFYFKGSMYPIKFQTTELHNPFPLKPKWARLLKKKFHSQDNMS